MRRRAPTHMCLRGNVIDLGVYRVLKDSLESPERSLSSEQIAALEELESVTTLEQFRTICKSAALREEEKRLRDVDRWWDSWLS
jgi:hypothetical protein